MKSLFNRIRILFRLKNIEKMLNDNKRIQFEDIQIVNDSMLQLQEMYYHLLNNSNRKMKRKWKRIRRNIPQNN